MPAVTIDECRASHIFRAAPGHFREDTAANRRILLDAANRPENFRGTDEFGTDWFMETLDNGTQAWAQVRDRKIVNGGVNPRPAAFVEVM